MLPQRIRTGCIDSELRWRQVVRIAPENSDQPIFR